MLLHRLQRDRKIADYVKVVVILGTGWTVAMVAETFLGDEQTVRLWWEKYDHDGEKELDHTLLYRQQPKHHVAWIPASMGITGDPIFKNNMVLMVPGKSCFKYGSCFEYGIAFG